jgi:hypothetical protein
LDEFAEALIEKVWVARAALKSAAESTERFAMTEALDELERVLHLARENGVEVPPAGDGPGRLVGG